MKLLKPIFLFCIVSSCGSRSTETLSANALLDSAIVLTNDYKDTSKFEQAISLLNQALRQDSTLFNIYKNKYFFEVTLGDYKSALKTNYRLIDFKPDSADLYFQAAIFEQFFQDTVRAHNSFSKAALTLKNTMNRMSANSPYYFYYWRLWACSMIMIGHENLVHSYLRDNCTTSIDSAIYHPEMLSKSKKELAELIIQKLHDQKYRR